MDRDKGLGGAGQPDDLDLTGGNDEEWHDLVAHLYEHLSSSNSTHMPMRGNPLNLRRGQRRKHAFNTRSQR